MDYLTIGDYTMTFDEQGASIKRGHPRATYRITATARGFQPSSKEINIEGDELQNVALSLERLKE